MTHTEEITVTLNHSCGHDGTAEFTPEEVQAGVVGQTAERTRMVPCQACQWAIEAVTKYEAGDLDGTQETLVGWVQIIIASNDHRAKRLMALVRQPD